MGRKTIKVNKTKLQNAIKEAEKDGPLTNLSALWIKAAEIYNGMSGIPEPITHSVAMLRTKAFKLKHQTKPGKRGGGKGFGGNKGNRTTKADKLKNSAKAQKALKILREHITEERFLTILERIEKGSRSAAVKMKCIECMGFQPAEVKRCTVYTCPLWCFRPYQGSEELEKAATV